MSDIQLPLPVARLRRRSFNAKNAKDQHDTAYFAWEVSVRLAVAVRPPADLKPLMRGSVGTWVGAAKTAGRALEDSPLLRLYALLTEVGLGQRSERRSVTPKELLDALPAYRNKVVGHGSARPPSFYAQAGKTLLDALDAAWQAEVFLPATGRVVAVESIAIDEAGAHQARLLDLTGEAPMVFDPRGTAVPATIRPRRLYWRAGEAYTPLHPWVLFAEEEERLYCFNGLGRGAEYLDYASGEVLRGAALELLCAGIEDELRALFASPRVSGPEEEKGEAADDPDRFGEFRILGKLGEGGMGVVFLARQETLGRVVALKMLPSQTAQDPVAKARFRREVAALSRCEHPNVAKILTSGQERGIPYYAMEYVEGADLAAVARAMSDTDNFAAAVSTACAQAQEERKELFEHVPDVAREALRPSPGRSRFRDLARFFRDAARGVHHLHEHGVLHRDLKPGNLMVTASDQRAVVMDLGLAAVEDATVSLTRDKSQILGTLRYLPPEQLQRNLLSMDRRADVYSLGATLYELLTDRSFFDGDTEARLIEQVLREEPLPIRAANPKAPKDLAAIVHKATAKDRDRRYATGRELADDLQRYLKREAIRARPAGPVLRLRYWARRRPAVAMLLVVLIVAIPALAGLRGYLLAKRADIAEGERQFRLQEIDRHLRIGAGKAFQATTIFALTPDSSSPRGPGRLGRSPIRTRQSNAKAEEAIAEYRAALRLDPSAVEAVASMTGLYCELEQYDKALEVLDQHRSLETRFPGLLRLRAANLAKAKRQEEADALRSTFSAPATCEDHFLAGVERLTQALLRVDDGFDKLDKNAAAAACDHFRNAVYLSPRPREVYYLQAAWAALWASDSAEAERLSRCMADLWPPSDERRLLRLTMFLIFVLTSGKPPEWCAEERGKAIGVAEEILNQTNDVTIVVLCSLVLRTAGKEDRALAVLEQVSTRVADSSEVHWHYGESLASAGRFDEAIASYRKALALAPDDFDAHLSLAQALGAKQRWREAVESAQAAVALKPDDAEGHLTLGYCLLAQGDGRQAVPSFEKAVTLDPDNADCWHALAMALRKSGESARAVCAFEKAVALNPQDADSYGELGRLLLEEGDAAKAIVAFEKALTIAPDNADYMVDLGNALVKGGRPREALVWVEKAAKIEGDSAQVEGVRGMALIALGDREAAIRALKKAVEIDENRGDAYCLLGQCSLGVGDWETAAAYYSRAIALCPEDSAAHYGAGIAAGKVGKRVEAIDHLKKAVALAPEDVECLLELGKALKGEGRVEEAIAAYRAAEALDKVGSQCSCMLAEALAAQGDLQGAIDVCLRVLRGVGFGGEGEESGPWTRFPILGTEMKKTVEGVLRKGVAEKPDDVTRLIGLGNALEWIRETEEEAIAVYRRAVELGGGAADAYMCLGRALTEASKVEEAVAVLRESLAVHPAVAGLWNALGLALERKGDYTQAVEAYRKAVEVGGETFERYCNLGYALLKSGDHLGAVGCLGKAKELCARCGTYQNQVGVFHLGRGDTLGALRAFELASMLEPEVALFWKHQGEMLKVWGGLRRAIEAYERALAIGGMEESGREGLAWCLWARGDFERAAEEYRKLLEGNEYSAAGPYGAGKLCALRGEMEEAERLLGRAVDLEPREAGYWIALGRVRLRRGDLGEAESCFERARGLGDEEAGELQNRCRRMIAMEGELAAVASGESVGMDSDKLELMAAIAEGRRRYGAAAALLRRCFAQDSGKESTEDAGAPWAASLRVSAAAAAARAGCGDGEDGKELSEAGRAEWRGQALGWLGKELGEIVGRIAEPGSDKMEMRRRIGYLRYGSAFAGIRDRAFLEKLPEEERLAFAAFWKEVEDVFARLDE